MTLFRFMGKGTCQLGWRTLHRLNLIVLKLLSLSFSLSLSLVRSLAFKIPYDRISFVTQSQKYSRCQWASSFFRPHTLMHIRYQTIKSFHEIPTKNEMEKNAKSVFHLFLNHFITDSFQFWNVNYLFPEIKQENTQQ